MTTRPEAIIYALLERHSHWPDGSAVDPENALVDLFLQRGLLEYRNGGASAVTTEKGREAMRLVFGVRARNNRLVL